MKVSKKVLIAVSLCVCLIFTSSVGTYALTKSEINDKIEKYKSQNSKLQIGDQFSATQFILGQPLTATDVVSVREPRQQDTYIAGAKTGLTKIELLNV